MIEVDDIGKYIQDTLSKTPKWKRAFWDFTRKIENKKRERKIKRWTKKTMKLFPFFDYSYFFDIMSIWAEEASKEYKNSDLLVSSPKTSKELLIVSELCKRLSEGYADENEYEFWKKKYGGFDNIPKHQFERIRKRASGREKQDAEYLFHLMKRKYRGWWE